MKRYALELSASDGIARRNTKYLKQVKRNRIVTTRWIENARGFETIDEALEVANSLRGKIGYLLGVADRCDHKPIHYLAPGRPANVEARDV